MIRGRLRVLAPAAGEQAEREVSVRLAPGVVEFSGEPQAILGQRFRLCVPALAPGEVGGAVEGFDRRRAGDPLAVREQLLQPAGSLLPVAPDVPEPPEAAREPESLLPPFLGLTPPQRGPEVVMLDGESGEGLPLTRPPDGLGLFPGHVEEVLKVAAAQIGRFTVFL